MKEAFEEQAASLGSAQESVGFGSTGQLSFDDVIAEGLGDWLKKAKDGFSKAGTRLNNALTVDGAKGIGKAVADKAKGVKDSLNGLKGKAKGAVSGVSWGKLAKVCLAILAVGAIITAVMAALSGEDVPQESEASPAPSSAAGKSAPPSAGEEDTPKEEEELKEFSSFRLSYDTNGDGKMDAEKEFSSIDEYKASVQQLISDRKSFIGEGLEQHIGEDGCLADTVVKDRADFDEDNKISEIHRDIFRTSGQKIEYADGTVLKNNAELTDDEYNVAVSLAHNNTGSGAEDFRSMSPEEKIRSLKESWGEKAVTGLLRKFPELINKPGVSSEIVGGKEELDFNKS